MTGLELAQIIGPAAKWIAIVSGSLIGIFGLIWLLRFWIRQAKEDEIRLEDFKTLEKDRSDFREKLKESRRRMRDAARRGWLRDGKRRDDSAT